MNKKEDIEFAKLMSLQRYLRDKADIEYMCYHLGLQDERDFWQIFLWNNKTIRWNDLPEELRNQLSLEEYQKLRRRNENEVMEVLSKFVK